MIAALKGRRQNINFLSKYVLSVSDQQLFVSRMPKMCAIPQLISASMFQSIDCRLFKILHPNTLTETIKRLFNHHEIHICIGTDSMICSAIEINQKLFLLKSYEYRIENKMHVN